MNTPDPLRLRAQPTRALPIPPDWTRRAACLDYSKRASAELDWIEPLPEHIGLCRAVCANCPVRRDCLTAALITAEPWGIWGGLDVDERTELARQYGLPIPGRLPVHGVHSRYIRHGCRCGACRYAHALYERERRRAAQPHAQHHPARRRAQPHSTEAAAT